jgi:hypothetical protein
MLFGGCHASSRQHDAISYPKNYVQLSAREKRDWIWEEGIKRTEYKSLPPFQNIKIAKLIFGNLQKKMEHQLDFVPHKWAKAIHRRAVVAKVFFKPVSLTPYTGIFAEDSIGLLRASLTYKPNKRGVAPGIALKFFIDHQQSRDASFLTGLESHGQNYNFFAKPFSNMVPKSQDFGARFVSWLFKRVSKKSNFISVKHFSEIRPGGELVPASMIKSLAQIFLQTCASNNDLKFTELPKRDIRIDLMQLKSGECILDVFAREDERQEDYENFTQAKSDKYFQQAKLIGKIILESSFVASQFGDDQLFFRHQRYD